MPVTIFFCYAREDEALLNKLKAHLRPLQRQNLIDVWHDRDISAGIEWEQEIKKYLNTAQVILLLVSPDFVDSDYCYGIEMKRAIERHEQKETRVIPVILRPVYWQVDPLNKLQALPTDGEPVTSDSWYNLDKALFNVTEGIRKVVEQLIEKHTSVSPIVSEEAQPKGTQVSTRTPIAQPVREEVQPKVTQARTHMPIAQSVRNVSPFIAPLPVQELRILRTLTGHTTPYGFVDSVAISPDGQTLVSSERSDNTIKVWDLSTGREMRTLTGHKYPVSEVAISPDGQTLVSVGGLDKTIKVWGLSTGREMRTLTGHTRGVGCVAISPDGQTVASGSEDKTIKVWDLSTGSVRTLTGHTSAIYSVAISSDGQTVASGGNDKTIKVWDLSTGKEMRTLTGHTDYVKSLAISPDGQQLFSGSYDCTIKVWGA